MIFLVCLLIGIAAAFTGSLVGLGGGAILVPSLLVLNQYSEAFAWATPQTIVGLSLIVMIFTAWSSASSYYKAGRVDVQSGLWFLLGSIPGGIIGSWLNQFFDTDAFFIYFGVMMIIISLLFLLKRREPSEKLTAGKSLSRTFTLDGKTHTYTIAIVPAFFISLLVGMISGLFGLGGGSIMVPAMILLFGFPAHIATATSMFMIFFVSIIGAGTHVVLGHIVWEYVLFFIPGAWIGGKLGAMVNQQLNSRALEWILRIVLIVIGIRMIYQGLA